MSRIVLLAVSRAGRRGVALTLGLAIVSLALLLFISGSQVLHARAGSSGQDQSAVKPAAPAARVRLELVRTPRDGITAAATCRRCDAHEVPGGGTGGVAGSLRRAGLPGPPFDPAVLPVAG